MSSSGPLQPAESFLARARAPPAGLPRGATRWKYAFAKVLRSGTRRTAVRARCEQRRGQTLFNVVEHVAKERPLSIKGEQRGMGGPRGGRKMGSGGHTGATHRTFRRQNHKKHTEPQKRITLNWVGHKTSVDAAEFFFLSVRPHIPRSSSGQAPAPRARTELPPLGRLGWRVGSGSLGGGRRVSPSHPEGKGFLRVRCSRLILRDRVWADTFLFDKFLFRK